MKIESKAFTIPELKSRESNIDLEPGFQRGKVWSPTKKQKFLDSLLREWPTPKVFLRLTDKEHEIYQCIDGQQRLRTIFEFLNGKIPLLQDPSGSVLSKKFSKLKPSIKDKFTNYKFNVDIVEDDDDNIIGEFYLRLNQGVTVNSSEKLKSIGGKMKDFVWKLAKK